MRSSRLNVRLSLAIATAAAFLIFGAFAINGGRIGGLEIGFDWSSWTLLNSEFTQEDGAGNWHSGHYYQFGPTCVFYHRTDYYRHDNAGLTNAPTTSHP